MTACDDCLRRTDLIAAIAGRLQVEFKQRTAPGRVLALPDDDLLEIARRRGARGATHRFDASAARERAAAARADHGLPVPRRLPDAAARPRRPAGGAPRPRDACARRTRTRSPSSAPAARRRTGSRSPRALGRGLSAARVPVVSGLALGVDSAAHAGALQAPGTTIARARRQRRTWPTRARVAAARRGRRARRGDLGAAARAPRPTAGASSPATASSPRSAPPRSSSRRPSARARSRPRTSPPSSAARSARSRVSVTTRLSAGTHGLIQAGAPLIRDARRRARAAGGRDRARRTRSQPPPRRADAAAAAAARGGRGRRGSLPS